MFFAVEHVTVLTKSSSLSFLFGKIKLARILHISNPYLSQNFN